METQIDKGPAPVAVRSEPLNVALSYDQFLQLLALIVVRVLQRERVR